MSAYRRDETVRDTGHSTASHGGVANTGRIDNLTVNQVPGTRVRSAYRERVRAIAPDELIEREAEYARLVTFCTAPGPGYLWLRAPAWAGKSALMSWFVLHPPDGVAVVSFFVTARFAGQNDRIAFAEVLIEQLAELLAEPLPPLLTESTREAHLAGMLSRAAEGRRLVLVVDGLDEDRGVTAGADAYSIAALLPADPPEGLRVVVASRPHPPVPVDVSQRHPLRDPGIVQDLARSPHAEVVRQDAERELKQLIHGSAEDQKLLGLLTASGGGLSVTDLAELSNIEVWDVEEHLEQVSARTFATQAGRWRPELTKYGLAHEELQRLSVRRLGEARLSAHRDRLHAWADGYRQRGWPPGTPGYLLAGYFVLLQSTGDQARMLECATDAQRHARMQETTGGDYVALAEISATSSSFAVSEPVDLPAIASLAVHRHELEVRAGNVPVALPGAWGRAGNLSRAEILARCLRDSSERSRAMAEVAEAAVAAGDLDFAERVADGIPDPRRRSWAVSALMLAASRAGDRLRVDRLVNLEWDNAVRNTLPGVAVLLAAGELAAAENAARAIQGNEERVSALTGVVLAAAGAGQLDIVRRLAEQATALIPAIGSEIRRAARMNDLVRASASADGFRVEALVALAVDLSRAIRQVDRRAVALADAGRVAVAARVSGLAAALFESAKVAAQAPADGYLRVRACVQVLQAMARTGRADSARDLVVQAGKSVEGIADPSQRVRGYALLAQAYAVLDEDDLVMDTCELAEAAAKSVTDADQQMWSLLSIVAPLDTVDRRKAAAVLERIEVLARDVWDVEDQVSLLVLTAEAVAVTGDRQRAGAMLESAENLARTLAQPIRQEVTLGRVSRTAAASGHLVTAERIARSVAASQWASPGGPPLGRVASAFVDAAKESDAGSAGKLLDHAEALVAELGEEQHDARQGWHAHALAHLAERVAGIDQDRAYALARHAYRLVLLMPRSDWQHEVQIAVACAMAASGQVDRAEQISVELTSIEHQARAKAGIAVALAGIDPDRAAQFTAQAEASCAMIHDQHSRSAVQVAIGAALIAAGAGAAAYSLAQTIVVPDSRAEALAAVAAARAVPEAEDLLVELLQGPHWHLSLLALGQVCPQAVIAIADHLTGATS